MAEETGETFGLPPEQTAAVGGEYGDDEPITPDEMDQMISGVTHPEGDYTFQLADVKYDAPTKEKPTAGMSVKLFVKQAPAPTNGKPAVTDPITANFNEFFSPDDGKKQAMQIAKRSKLELLKAIGLGTPEPDGKIYANKALVTKGKGRMVIATVSHRKDKNGRTRQDIVNYRPIEG